MFWNKAKQALKDKDAGLVFNWRNNFSLKYPLLAFIFLSLVAHFFFLQIFKFPERPKHIQSINTGTILFLSDSHSPDVQRLLVRAGTLGIATPRGTAKVDPLTMGIDDQLTGPLNAGLHDWKPKAKPYQTLPFEETGAHVFLWEHGLPLVNTSYLPDETIRENTAPVISLSVNSISPELKEILPSSLPEQKYSSELLGKTISFIIQINREGQLFLITPVNNESGMEAANKEGESWLRSIKWNPSLNGAEGVISLTWKGKRVE